MLRRLKIETRDKKANWEKEFTVLISIAELLAIIVFSVSFPISSKIKGILLSTTMIAVFRLIGHVGQIIQPLIYRANISIKNITIIACAGDLLWSLNVVYFAHTGDKITFIYAHLIINIALSGIYESLRYKIDHFVGEIGNYERYRSNVSFVVGVSGVVASAVSAVLFNYIQQSSLLYAAGLLNILTILNNIVIYKLYIKSTNDLKSIKS